MKITYLANHPEHLLTIAKWIMDEWGHESPGMTLEKMEARFRGNMKRFSIPITLLAMNGDVPVGTASLVIHDMNDHLEYSPWLAAVYVLPEKREQGIGTKLVKAVELLGAQLDVEKLYLFTPDCESFYTRMNWTVHERTRYREKDVVLMVKEIF